MESLAVNVDTALVLNDGGLRSLAATSTLIGGQRPILLYVHDGRVGDDHCHAHFTEQADYFHAARRIELSLPHLSKRRGPTDQPAALARFQLLAAAAGQAATHRVERVIWPINVGEHFDELATISEALVLLEHAVELETARQITIETPLLELTLKQVVELGEQSAVPWRLARSCRGVEAEPCGQCAGCLERAAAFEAAGIEDPLHASSRQPGT